MKNYEKYFLLPPVIFGWTAGVLLFVWKGDLGSAILIAVLIVPVALWSLREATW